MQSLHALSLLFIVFALAKQYDTTTADYHIEAYDYFVLSRVVLLFDSPITSTTVLAVQVMVRLMVMQPMRFRLRFHL